MDTVSNNTRKRQRASLNCVVSEEAGRDIPSAVGMEGLVGLYHSVVRQGQEAMQTESRHLAEPRRAQWRKQRAVICCSLISCTAAGGPTFHRELRAASAAVNGSTTF